MQALNIYLVCILKGFPGGSEVQASASSAGDPGSIPGLGRFPGEGNVNPLQNSCLENPMDGGSWWATVHGVAKSRTRLSDFILCILRSRISGCTKTSFKLPSRKHLKHQQISESFLNTSL